MRMGTLHTTIGSELAAWIAKQHIFFVATAPLGADGLLNCSPKGGDTFRVLNPRTVAYQDLTGSGAETIAHLRENGRMIIMFCAFEGEPLIVRLYGRGHVILPDEAEYPSLVPLFTSNPGMRAIIKLDVTRVSDSCGMAVLALGRQARFLNVRKPGDTRLWQYEPLHALAEAYSDAFEKWVVVDVHKCSMFTRKDSPVPLNALELHQLLLDGNGATVEAHQRKFKSFELEAPLHLQTRAQLDEYLSFFSRFIITMDNNLVQKAREAEKPVLDYEDMDMYCRVAWYDDRTPVRETSQATSDPVDLYPSINQVHMDLSFEHTLEGGIEVYLTHCMPNLDYFEVQVDAKAWQRVGSGMHARVFNWVLHEGSNEVRVRGVNSSGLTSRESTISLGFALQTSGQTPRST